MLQVCYQQSHHFTEDCHLLQHLLGTLAQSLFSIRKTLSQRGRWLRTPHGAVLARLSPGFKTEAEAEFQHKS